MRFSIKGARVTVGLEIHQQLATGRKLFCGCAPVEAAEYPARFQRRLRASRGELGEFDQAALFEGAKSRTMLYLADPQSSCLVERDEEPPHPPDPEAKKTVLLIAAALESSVFGEIFPMRKTVIDGSNTAGFQRTMLVSRGGHYTAGGRRIGIQSVCLEEDAARILGAGAADGTKGGDPGGGDAPKRYGLDRLGIPLVEVATEPFEAEPGLVRDAALALGRILRSTKRVRRGLGSIRQDVNVSIGGGGGATVVEVKGVQQLDQLEKVVEYEAGRQHGLLRISERLQSARWRHSPQDRFDITGAMAGCGSKVIRGALKKAHRVYGVSFRGLAGVFGFAPYEGIRLGRDVAELVRFFGMGGVFHSDELPDYGMTGEEVGGAKRIMRIGEGDAFLILAAPAGQVHTIIDQVVLRMERIRDAGIPADTRMATRDGETRFLRPRPGAARMYPETDVPPITVSGQDLKAARDEIPKPWDEAVRDIRDRYGLNAQLAEQVFDSEYAGLFEEICGSTKNPPNFVASTLCSTLLNLERRGLDRTRLSTETVSEVFGLLDGGRIPKESVEMIFEEIMSGGSAEDAIRKSSSSGAMSDGELDSVLGRILEEHGQIVEKQGGRAMGPLMGIAMGELRGRVSGERISRKLEEKIRKSAKKN